MSNIRVFTSGMCASLALPEPDDDEMSILGSADYAPGVPADSLRVRQMLLAHDQYDRTGERFPVEYLQRFAETLPGKSVLTGHDKNSAPIGRFFFADVESRRELAFPVLHNGKDFGEVDEKAAPAGFVERRRTVKWLASKFYYPASDTKTDDAFTTGIWKWVSIGFRFDDIVCDVCRKSYLKADCPHYIMQELEDGRLVTATYGGKAEKAEALEGSSVFLGAQQMARIIKRVGEKLEVDPLEIASTPHGIDAVAFKSAEAYARVEGWAQKVWEVPAITQEQPLEAATSTGTDEPAKQEESHMDYEKLAAERLTALEETQAKLAAAEAETKRLADELAGVQPMAEAGRKALKAVSEKALDDALAVHGLDSTLLQSVFKALAERGDFEELNKHALELQAERLKKFPPGTSADLSLSPERRISDAASIITDAKR